MKKSSSATGSNKTAGTLTAQYDIHGDYSSQSSDSAVGQTTDQTMTNQTATDKATNKATSKVLTSQYDINSD
ncbi:Hypothetical protein LUCI_2091 [Lucifera butyrica]|uniref:Uncharacterized protein n=1 Tax=Lucifera butyrica TaxID=1351585 RepID=A0A498R5X1_9FIRM|nr:hypothetical protein [Lucifera butyrica]VBB06854.1 Hypothetical protein LUCI_2091 [Lucifera butyrica]